MRYLFLLVIPVPVFPCGGAACAFSLEDDGKMPSAITTKHELDIELDVIAELQLLEKKEGLDPNVLREDIKQLLAAINGEGRKHLRKVAGMSDHRRNEIARQLLVAIEEAASAA